MRILVGKIEQESRKNKPQARDLASKILMSFEGNKPCHKEIRNILIKHLNLSNRIICHIGHYLGHHGLKDSLHKLDSYLNAKEIMALHASYHIARLGSHINEAKSLRDPYQELFYKYQMRKGSLSRA